MNPPAANVPNVLTSPKKFFLAFWISTSYVTMFLRERPSGFYYLRKSLKTKVPKKLVHIIIVFYR
jgi:hypothetical protein